MRNTPKNLNVVSEPLILRKQVGSTLYTVGVHFSPDAMETLDDKIRRLLINDLKTAAQRATMKPLQAGWLPERGSL